MKESWCIFMRRFCSFFLLLVLACGMLSVSSSAVDITVSGTGTGYSAYKLFDLSQGLKPGHSDDGDCPVENCDKTNDPDGHWSYAYSLNWKYVDALLDSYRDSVGLVDESNLLSGIQELDGDRMRVFARDLYWYVAGFYELMPEYTSETNKFTGVDPGYYLIAQDSDVPSGDSVSLVMLDTAGLEDVTVTSKECVPTLTKKIGTYSDTGLKYLDGYVRSVDDYAWWYELTAEFPSESIDMFESYPEYEILFHDVLSPGLYVEAHDVEVYAYIPGESAYGLNITDSSHVGILVGELDGELDDGCDLEVAVLCKEGSRPVSLGLDAGAEPVYNNDADADVYTGPYKIVVRYLGSLTDDFVVGSAGNPNTAHLEFSNNPYDYRSTTNTPDDKVSVFASYLVVNKTDGSKPLAGAAFDLCRWVGISSDEQGRSRDDGWVKSYMEESDDGTSFGHPLFPGKYKLVETTVPDGYQKADDLIFNVIMEAEELSDDPKLTKLDIVDEDGNSLTQGEDAVFVVDMDTGMITTNVANYAGVKLPTTGGAGVYWIYVAGVVAVLAAGLAVTANVKKRRV